MSRDSLKDISRDGFYMVLIILNNRNFRYNEIFIIERGMVLIILNKRNFRHNEIFIIERRMVFIILNKRNFRHNEIFIIVDNLRGTPWGYLRRKITLQSFRLNAFLHLCSLQQS